MAFLALSKAALYHMIWFMIRSAQRGTLQVRAYIIYLTTLIVNFSEAERRVHAVHRPAYIHASLSLWVYVCLPLIVSCSGDRDRFG